MDAGSEGEMNRNMNHSPSEGSKRPKRQMKTPFQLEMLEKTYASMLSFYLLCGGCYSALFVVQFVCSLSFFLKLTILCKDVYVC